MNFDFADVLTRAGRITWNNKALWILGILAALGSGGGSSFNTDFSGGGDGGAGLDQFQRALERMFGQRVDESLLVIIGLGLLCVGLIIGIVLIALSVIGRGGLIGGTQLAERNGRVSFGEAWSAGVSKFWTLFIIGLVVGVAGFVVSLMSVFAFITICLAPLACVGVIVVIVLSVVGYPAQIAAVTENLGIGDALGRAWAVIQANVAAIIILGLILAVISGVIGFVIGLPIVFIVFPPLLAVATGGEEALGAGMLFAGLCFVAYLPVLLLLAGILQTWVTAAWTLAYQRFTGVAPAPGMPQTPPPIMPA